MTTGFLKKIVTDKGYGFCSCDDRREDVFIHKNDLHPDSGIVFRNLREGERVQFDIEETERGLRARRVYLAS